MLEQISVSRDLGLKFSKTNVGIRINILIILFCANFQAKQPNLSKNRIKVGNSEN